MNQSAWLVRSSLLVLALAGTCGCDRAQGEANAASPPEASKVLAAPVQPVPAAPAPAAEPVVPAAQQSYREAEFTVAIEGTPSGKVGETLALTVKLDAASGFKVNQEYPLKFQFNPATGVAPEKQTVLKADATYEGHSVALPLKVKLETPGAHQLSGRLSFSVCKEGDASVCLLEKRELGVTLNAS